MDDAMMRQLLKTYGMDGSGPVSARNANAIREFGAANPNVLEHRAMGMRGSVLDDNSDLLMQYLDRVAAETAAPAGRVEVGQPQLAPQQAPAAATPARAARPREDMSGAVPPPAAGTRASRQGNYGGEAGASPRTSGYEVEPGTSSMGPSSDSIVPDWLKAMLGISPSAGVVAKGAARANARADGSAPQGQIGEQRKLPGGQYQNVEDVGKEMEGVTARNATSRAANDAMVQRDVNAENALLQEQLMKQAKQRQTEELLRRAGRAVGRR